MPQGVLCKIVGLQFVLMEQTHPVRLCEYIFKKKKKISGLVLSFSDVEMMASSAEMTCFDFLPYL